MKKEVILEINIIHIYMKMSYNIHNTNVNINDINNPQKIYSENNQIGIDRLNKIKI